MTVRGIALELSNDGPEIFVGIIPFTPGSVPYVTTVAIKNDRLVPLITYSIF